MATFYDELSHETKKMSGKLTANKKKCWKTRVISMFHALFSVYNSFFFELSLTVLVILYNLKIILHWPMAVFHIYQIWIPHWEFRKKKLIYSFARVKCSIIKVKFVENSKKKNWNGKNSNDIIKMLKINYSRRNIKWQFIISPRIDWILNLTNLIE